MHAQTFKLQQSLIYLIFIGFFWIGGIAIVFTLPLLFKIKLLVLMLTMLYGVHLIWRFGLLQGPHAITGLTAMGGGQWLVQTRSSQYEARLRGDSTVTHFASVLRFQLPDKHFPISCTIFRDSLPGDDYRRIVVLARHG